MKAVAGSSIKRRKKWPCNEQMTRNNTAFEDSWKYKEWKKMVALNRKVQ